MSRLRVEAVGLVLGAAILAGCVAGGHWFAEGGAGPPLRAVPLEAAMDDVFPAAPAPAEAPPDGLFTMPSPWGMVLVGAEFGIYSFSDDDIGEWFGDATYGGVKLAWEPGLNWGVSLSAGYYRAGNRTEGGEDIVVFPVRGTLELGGLLFFTQSRWFLGAGAGYAFMNEIPSEDKIDLWPSVGLRLDDEWAAHAVCGFEFRNESVMALRVEGGHAWLFESDADVWMVTGTLSLQF